MKQWKAVAVDPVPEGTYFLCSIHESKHYRTVLYYARGIAGKVCMSMKPGIAVHLEYEGVVNGLKANPGFVAVQVPDDWETRWKRRKRRSRW